jgi:hypothetical protein
MKYDTETYCKLGVIETRNNSRTTVFLKEIHVINKSVKAACVKQEELR